MKKRKTTTRQVRPPVDHDRRVPLGLETIYKRANGNPDTCFIELTKEMAEDWFSNHLNQDRQRNLKDATITTLLRFMEDGLWTDYKSNIVFDTKREIRNGQHVLKTLMATNAYDNFIIQLMINLPPDVCDSWDLIAKRSVADELKIQGFDVPNRQTLGSAAKILWQYLRGLYTGMGYLIDRTPGKIAAPPEAVKIAREHPGLQLCIFPINQAFVGKQFSSAALYVAKYILRQFDQDAAEVFFLRLNDGLNLTDKNDPIWVLRQTFLRLQPDERIRNGVTMALVFKAWNLHRAKAKVSGPLLRKNEPFPLLEQMEIPDGQKRRAQ